MKSEIDRHLKDLENLPEQLKSILSGNDLTKKVGQRLVDLKDIKLSTSIIKYIGKFIYDSNVETLVVQKALLPLMEIKNNNVKILNLSSTSLSLNDIFILSIFLESSNSICEINLSHNYIFFELEQDELEFKFQNKIDNHKQRYSSETSKRFMKSLGNKLKSLDISYNLIPPFCIDSLKELIMININLELLNISSCSVGEKDMLDIIKYIEKYEKIKELNLNSNKIGDEGATIISKYIEAKKSLQFIELFSCGINEKGGKEIYRALCNNFCIFRMSISNNSINPQDVENIQNLIFFNNQFHIIKNKYLANSGFAAKLISEALRRWAKSEPALKEKIQQRIKNPVDELDKEILKEIQKEDKLDLLDLLDLSHTPAFIKYNSTDQKISTNK